MLCGQSVDFQAVCGQVLEILLGCGDTVMWRDSSVEILWRNSNALWKSVVTAVVCVGTEEAKLVCLVQIRPNIICVLEQRRPN